MSRTLAAVAVCALAMGCEHRAPSSRTVPVEQVAQRVSTATRLGFRPRIALLHDTPRGWVPRPAKSFRLVDMALPGAGETTCVVSFVPGAAGGVVANVNRWRRQMNLDPQSPEEVAQLPRAALLGQTGVVLALEGTFADSMRNLTREGWAMVGAMAPMSDGMVFVKMTGPQAEVAAQRPAFDQFLASLRFPQ